MGHDEIIWRNPAGRAQRGFSRIFPAFGSYTLKEAELLGILDEMLEGKKTIVILYVKYDDNFTAANNYRIADDIERINRKFLAEERGYVLVGPGRWGSSDSWLGIPVKWPHISAARVIAEVALKNYRVDPSQGTHFFQNLTSFGVGYFTIDSNTNELLANRVQA